MNEHELMAEMKVSKAVAKMAVPSVVSSLVTRNLQYGRYIFCGTDRRRPAGGGSQPDKPDFYSADGLCQHAGNGRQRRGVCGTG